MWTDCQKAGAHAGFSPSGSLGHACDTDGKKAAEEDHALSFDFECLAQFYVVA